MTSSTTSDTKFHLDQALASLERGQEALRRKQRDAARRAFLGAAHSLAKAAAASPEPLRTARLKQSDALLRLGQTLEDVRVIQPPPATPASRLPAESGAKSPQWLAAERPGLKLDDVAGLDEVKEQIRVRMVYPFTHPELAQRFRIPTGGGVLLYGPPGTGKTFLARAAAGELEATFFAVKGSELLSKWFGEAEQNIASLFNEARRHPRTVIFIDEIEGMVPKRDTTASSVMPRVVGQMLQELEGFEGRQPGQALLFLGATNKPWLLDEAIMRPGRFDVKIYIPPPDFPARVQILLINLKDKPLGEDVSLDELSQRTDGYSGADLRGVAEMATILAFRDVMRTGVDRPIGMPDFDQALRQVKPSISQRDLERLERWRREQDG